MTAVACDTDPLRDSDSTLLVKKARPWLPAVQMACCKSSSCVFSVLQTWLSSEMKLSPKRGHIYQTNWSAVFHRLLIYL